MDFSKLRFTLAEDENVSEVRRLVNVAYQGLADLGLNFTGTYQDEAMTRERMQGQEVHLVYLGDELLATVSLGLENLDDGEEVLYLGQFAVAPDYQKKGLGRMLMQMAEKRAREQGIRRLSLDTAVPATHLVSFYSSEGYSIYDQVQWEGKTYQSYIMEKTL